MSRISSDMSWATKLLNFAAKGTKHKNMLENANEIDACFDMSTFQRNTFNRNKCGQNSLPKYPILNTYQRLTARRPVLVKVRKLSIKLEFKGR